MTLQSPLEILSALAVDIERLKNVIQTQELRIAHLEKTFTECSPRLILDETKGAAIIRLPLETRTVLRVLQGGNVGSNPNGTA